jgi:Arc/MetJ-type ribon-helix-helix transcriptional regulator
MEVHLSKDLERLVQEKVESGRYRSSNEVISQALLVLDERDHALDARASGPAPPTSVSSAESSGAWEEFFRLGHILAGSGTQESGTLTAAVFAMRR